VRLSLGRDQVTGRRRYLNRTIRGWFRAAQHYLNARIEECDQGRKLDGECVNLNRYLGRWLELAVQPKLRAKSYRDYKALLDLYVCSALGERELRSLTPFDLQLVYFQMYDRGLSKRTVHYAHAVLHAAFEQAVGWRLMTTNPASGLAIPHPVRGEMRVLNPDEAKRFLEHAATTKFGILFALALTTGMRPSEYLALRWSDINWQEETVTVVRILEKGRGWRFANTKRARSHRQVKLQSWVVHKLGQMHARETASPCTNQDAAGQIFKARLGRPINNDYLAREFKSLLREAGLPKMRLYDLRHTAATLALAAGVPAKFVSEQLGHASSAFPLDVYSHVLPHMQSEAAVRVEALLGMNSHELEGNRAQTRKSSQSVRSGQTASGAQQFTAPQVS